MPADQLSVKVDGAEAAVWAVLRGEPVGDAALAAALNPFELTEAAAAYRRAGRAALEQAVTDTWQHLYIEFSDWNRAENVFAEHILPVLLQHQFIGQVRSWWFLRKHPCWRLRLLTPAGTVLPAELTAALNEAAKHRHLSCWWPGIYEAETAAFGGQEAMVAIHELFAADSIAALTLRPTIKNFGARELSILLISTMARAAGLEWYEQGDLWDRITADRPLPDGSPHAPLARMSESLLPLVRTDTSPGSALLAPSSPLQPTAGWIDAFRTAGRQLGIIARSGTAQRGLREILSYVIIFHWNRLGLAASAQAALAAAARRAILNVDVGTDKACSLPHLMPSSNDSLERHRLDEALRNKKLPTIRAAEHPPAARTDPAGAYVSSPSRSLCVDDKARRTYASIISTLRAARLNSGLTQEALALGLPVRGRAVSEWETGATDPTLGNLIRWAYKLARPLVIINHKSELLNGPIRQLPGESWEIFERRRLATPLRNRRLALGMTQEELGEFVGVSRDSIQRWELACIPPRPISHVVWAQMLGYSLTLRPIGLPDQRSRRLTTEGAALSTGQYVRHLRRP